MNRDPDREALEAIGRERARRIRETLIASLDAERVDITDKTWSHRRHDGARDGRGHFQLVVVSPRFSGLSRIARHRMVYDALADMMVTDIHALTIEALAPEPTP